MAVSKRNRDMRSQALLKLLSKRNYEMPTLSRFFVAKETNLR